MPVNDYWMPKVPGHGIQEGSGVEVRNRKRYGSDLQGDRDAPEPQTVSAADITF